MRNPFVDCADFTVSCPESATIGSPIHEIRSRGNLPLVLEQDMVIELKRSDLLENWRETCALGRKRADNLMQEAAARIQNALEDDEFVDVPSLATDAAAFFLLALRQKGVKFPCNIPACAVSYFHDEDKCNHGEIVVN
jgi:hypothetical protein